MLPLIKRILLGFLLITLGSSTVWSCKDDTRIDAYPVALQKITGKWEPFARRSAVGGKWISDTTYELLRFRYDGLLLNEFNEPQCCTPTWYIINKDTVDVTRKDQFKPSITCSNIDCISCEYLDIIVVKDTLIIGNCSGGASKYLRFKE